MQRIMLIRHAEKPHDCGTRDRGVDLAGHHDGHELTVRGWQRAGALARFFAPLGGHGGDAPVSTPRTIMASAAVLDSPSFRAQRTVQPLAELLGLAIDARFADGQEADAAAAALAAPGPVLIVWHHNHMRRLTKAIAGGRPHHCPHHWPDDRFDMVWVMDRAGEDWRFAQVPQQLLPGDSAEPFPKRPPGWAPASAMAGLPSS